MAQKFTVPITVKQLSSAGSDAITLYVDTETYSRLKIEAGGRLTWGPGNANGDVNLYRDGADVLRTDDTFKTPTLFVDNIEIDTTGAQTDYILKFDGTKFTAASATFGSSGATTLDELTDVTLVSPEKYQTLVYDGTGWINEFPTTVSLVNNAEATTLTVGTAVYLYGNVGNHASVKRADNSSDTTSSKTVGLVSAAIPSGGNGPVVTRGYVTGIDLSSGYTAGQVLWLGTNGGITTTKPTAPNHLVFIGVVVRATSNGIIYVATQNGYELDELHDVSITAPLSSGQFLKYNGTLWVNDAIDLGTDTTGNYVSSITAGTGISVNFTPSEDAGASVSLNATLDQLTDVSTSGATASDVLTYNGSSWIAASVAAGGANVTSSATPPASPNTGDLWLDSVNVELFIYYDSQWVQLTNTEPIVEDLNDLADVDVPSPAVGNFLKYDGTYWTAASIPSINALDDIGDVNVTGASNNQFLKYNGTTWVAASIPAINTLDDVGDVNVSGASSGQFLKWNGTNWVADSVVGGATASSSTPSSPTTGQLWFDTDDARTYVYYDSTWVEVGASGMAAVVSDSAPSSPISGQIWYKSDTGGTYVYYNSTWVEVGAAPAAILPTIVDAKGDLIVGTANDTVARQAVGANGTILMADSAQTNGIKWVGSGTVLQVKSTTKTDTFTSTSGSYTDITGLSVSITPTSSSSKILVLANILTAVDTDRGVFLQLVRGSTAIALGDAAGNRIRSTSAGVTTATDAGSGNVIVPHSINFLDSPATTSSTTYKIQGMVNLSSPSTFYVNRMGNDADATTRFRGISTITVMEISA